MKKILVGAAAGIGFALLVYKLAESGKLEDLRDDFDIATRRARKKMRKGMRVGRKQLEYLKGEASLKSEQLSEIAEDVERKVLEKLKKAKP